MRVAAVSERLGRPLKILVGKPGLDGHSNGAEQIAVKARDAGMEVVYEGIRLTPEEIVQSARDEGVHVIGLSILSGSHGTLVLDVLERLRRAGLAALPVIVGGIIPEEDAARLRKAGVKRVYTPKDFDLTRIMGEIVDVVAESPRLASELAQRVLARERDAVAEALNLVEDRRARAARGGARAARCARARGAASRARRASASPAPPGAGKSSLLDALVRHAAPARRAPRRSWPSIRRARPAAARCSAIASACARPPPTPASSCARWRRATGWGASPRRPARRS